LFIAKIANIANIANIGKTSWSSPKGIPT